MALTPEDLELFIDRMDPQDGTNTHPNDKDVGIMFITISDANPTACGSALRDLFVEAYGNDDWFQMVEAYRAMAATACWVTKDRRVLVPEAMELGHLRNSLNMMRRASILRMRSKPDLTFIEGCHWSFYMRNNSRRFKSIVAMMFEVTITREQPWFGITDHHFTGPEEPAEPDESFGPNTVHEQNL